MLRLVNSRDRDQLDAATCRLAAVYPMRPWYWPTSEHTRREREIFHSARYRNGSTGGCFGLIW